MKGLKKFEQINKGYVFISHSHSDIEKVRGIRNRLEKEGFEPLCFYLKCLNDDSEIEELIKREIDAREWFVFVDSENSRNSRWVQLEREYINSTNSKKVINLELDDKKSFARTINKILHHLRVCVVSSGVDRELSSRLQIALEKKDYLVFGSRNFKGQKNFWSTTKKEVAKAAKEGCVIALLSEQSMMSVYFKHQIRIALNKRGNVIPVLIGDAKISDDYARMLAGVPVYRLDENPTNEQITEMLDQIGDRITKL